MENAIETFMACRRDNRLIEDFPGDVPEDAATAYRYQDELIRRTGRPIAGWKVAAVRPEFRGRFGFSRLVAPATALLSTDGPEPIRIGGIAGASYAVEAEFAVRLAHDLPPGSDPETLLAAIAEVRCAVELVGSVVRDLPRFGPGAIIAEHGNCLCIVLGAPIENWRHLDDEHMTTVTRINGAPAGSGSLARLSGGLAGALGFLGANLRSRGYPLARDTWISTGATSGVHPIETGDLARIEWVGGHAIEIALDAAGLRVAPVLSLGPTAFSHL